jgi:hypothetical protein
MLVSEAREEISQPVRKESTLFLKQKRLVVGLVVEV